MQLLPTNECDAALKKIFIMIVSRILTTHMPFFQFACSDIVTWHKEHKYYKEMSTKSDVVRMCSITLFLCNYIF